MDLITIADLEVFYRIGVPEIERAHPQRLLLTVTLECEIATAAASDRVEDTLNYQLVVDDLVALGQGRTWKLLEKLVVDIADHLLSRYRPVAVTVEARKFIIPQTRYVSVSCRRVR